MQQAVEAVPSTLLVLRERIHHASFAVRWLLRACRRCSVPTAARVSVVVEQHLEEPGSFSSTRDPHRARSLARAPREPLMDESVYPLMSPALWRHNGRPTDPAELCRCACCMIAIPTRAGSCGGRSTPAALDVGAALVCVLRPAAWQRTGPGSRPCPSPPAQKNLASGALVRLLKHAHRPWHCVLTVRPREAPREA